MVEEFLFLEWRNVPYRKVKVFKDISRVFLTYSELENIT